MMFVQLYLNSLVLMNLLQETTTAFDDLGTLLLGGVAAAIVVAVGFTRSTVPPARQERRESQIFTDIYGLNAIREYRGSTSSVAHSVMTRFSSSRLSSKKCPAPGMTTSRTVVFFSRSAASFLTCSTSPNSSFSP